VRACVRARKGLSLSHAQPASEIVFFASTPADALDFCQSKHAQMAAAREAFKQSHAVGIVGTVSRISRDAWCFGAGLLTGLVLSLAFARNSGKK
jgi:hypothetical protein